MSKYWDKCSIAAVYRVWKNTVGLVDATRLMAFFGFAVNINGQAFIFMTTHNANT